MVNLILMRKLVILANESQRPYKVHEAKRKIQPIFYATLPWFPNYAVHPVRPSVCLSVRLSHAYRYRTSSSAVADRPCDASRMSVVSFNSTKRQAQSFIICYTLALDLPLRKLNYVLFSSLRRIHLCVVFCAVNRLAP